MRSLRIVALGALTAICGTACYPQYVGLGIPSLSGPPDSQDIQTNVDLCHSHLDDVAKNAYLQRKSQYNWTNVISSVTLLGGSASTFFGDKTVKTIGGVASLLTGLAGIWKGKADADLENTQARDSKVRETWGAVTDHIDAWQAAWNAHSDPADPAFRTADNELHSVLRKCTGVRR